MIHLVFTACLTIPSYACRESAVTIREDLSEFQCLTAAQVQLANWTKDNPQWRIVRWRCQSELPGQDV